MTLRLLISFSFAALALLAADVSGKVDLRDSSDPKVRKSKDLSGVVIWLSPIDAAQTQPAAHPARARMLQKNKRFDPHVLVVQTGATVDFPNLDPIYHNAFSNFDGKVFDVGLYPPGQNRSVRFDRSGVARLFCNIHSSMSAIVVVVSTPHFAVTRTDGSWQIGGVPPGQYRLEVYHERSTASTLQSLATTVTVPAAGLQAPLLSISERGFALAPHLNKFGAPYPPSDSNPIYPGAKH